MNPSDPNHPPGQSAVQERVGEFVQTHCSRWTMQRITTLVLAVALIAGGAVIIESEPTGMIGSNEIDRRIAIGSAMMIGGFLLLAVYVLTGILAVQPRPRSGND